MQIRLILRSRSRGTYTCKKLHISDGGGGCGDQGVRCDDTNCLNRDCNRVFGTRAALTIHQKRFHRDITNAPLFVCQRCAGERTVHRKKECKKCMKLLSKTNILRRRISCRIKEQNWTEMKTLPAGVYKAQVKSVADVSN